jgi:hypothetical protein
MTSIQKKIRTSLVYWITTALCCAVAFAQNDPPLAKVVSITLDPQTVTVLSLRPGFVTSVRMPEEVSSVVLGDPGAFRGEHSEAEPRLVFFKPTVTRAAKTNALINTRSGRAVPLTLVSVGNAAHDPVDYVLEYQLPRSFIIAPTVSTTFLIAEGKRVEGTQPQAPSETEIPRSDPERLKPDPAKALEWQGKQLRVAIGRTEENGEDMTVAFSVLNSSSRTIELLPPQIQLAGAAKAKHGKAITAEPVAIKAFRIATRRLAPGATTEGLVVFERPAFKQSTDRLLLQIAQVEEVDRPVVTDIAFVAPMKGAK